ncbi:MAG: glycosyltransferase [Aggregatilineales bacterium]
MAASVSIIIPTYQGAAWLPETLQAIRRQVYAAPIEIIAIDSESSDGTLQLLASYGARVLSIPQARFSHGYARNLGVQQAQGELCVFLSQDAQPIGTHWLHTLTAPLSDSGLGALYGRQIARPDATPFERFFIQSLYPAQSRRCVWQSGTPFTLEHFFFSNVCSAARRQTCLAFPFDEALIMSEDQAFAKALLGAGYHTYYCAEAAVLHSHRYTWQTLFWRNFQSAYSLRGIADDSFSSLARRALGYLLSEALYLLRSEHWRWLLRLPLYESARFSGGLLGRYANRLPLRWQLQLSLPQRACLLHPKRP